MHNIVYISAIAAVGILTLLWLGMRKYTKPQAVCAIQTALNKRIGKRDITGAVVRIDFPEHDLRQTFTAGSIIDENQPFHVASIGKTFTATLVGMLIDDGVLRFDDPIASYLDGGLLAGLFIYEGIDHSGEITVGQLLSHTSGIADYFEDKAQGSAPMRELVLTEKDKRWSPQALVAFTREHQSAVGRPGERFHYSDTGYILLGLLIEKASGMAFDHMLHRRIFEPLKMDDSYLLFYSEPKNEKRPIADVWLKGVNIKEYASLSMDWAGGGIVSTVTDLSVFIRALYAGKLIRRDTLETFRRFDRKYMIGVRYGCGLMQYRFGEFSFLLRSLPRCEGHMGILGTQMVYDRQTDGVYIASFSSGAAAPASVRMMIKALGILQRIKPV